MKPASAHRGRPSIIGDQDLYKNILVAIDLMEGPAHQVLSGALAFGEETAQYTVVHVVEPQYVQYSFDPTFTGSLTRELEQQAIENATDRMSELCASMEMTPQEQQIVLGRAADQIHELAKHRDLIVIGSHGWHGWRRLLGSTANAVLHGAPVDVAVIRIPENQDT